MDVLYENSFMLIITVSVYLSIWLIPKLLKGFLKGYLPEKGKMLATTENFFELKDQLKQNTYAVEEIKTSLNEQSWVNQQVWLKKQEAYESILLNMMNLNKAIEYRLKKNQSWLDSNITGFISTSGNQDEDYAEFEKDRENAWKEHAKKFGDKPKIEQEKIKEKMCIESLEKTIDMIYVKSIYLNEGVNDVALFIKDKINDFREPPMTENYDVEVYVEELKDKYQELSDQIKSKSVDIIALSRKELKLS
jgi:hypothetical protein